MYINEYTQKFYELETTDGGEVAEEAVVQKHDAKAAKVRRPRDVSPVAPAPAAPAGPMTHRVHTADEHTAIGRDDFYGLEGYKYKDNIEKIDYDAAKEVTDNTHKAAVYPSQNDNFYQLESDIPTKSTTDVYSYEASDTAGVISLNGSKRVATYTYAITSSKTDKAKLSGNQFYNLSILLTLDGTRAVVFTKEGGDPATVTLDGVRSNEKLLPVSVQIQSGRGEMDILVNELRGRLAYLPIDIVGELLSKGFKVTYYNEDKLYGLALTYPEGEKPKIVKFDSAKKLNGEAKGKALVTEYTAELNSLKALIDALKAAITAEKAKSDPAGSNAYLNKCLDRIHGFIAGVNNFKKKYGFGKVGYWETGQENDSDHLVKPATHKGNLALLEKGEADILEAFRTAVTGTTGSSS